MSDARAPSGGERCPFCGARLQVVAVHGHGQCARCGTNTEPCCAGADAQSEADVAPPAPTQLDPRLFARLFHQLGGEQATVTVDCLLHALARALDVPLDEARIVFDAGVDLGQLAQRGDTVRIAAPR